MSRHDAGVLIRHGDVEALARALDADGDLAHRPVIWHLGQRNESDPLHYVSDCVGHGWLTNGREGDIAALLIARGAGVDGAAGRESPLIGAVSLGAERVSTVLIEAGAELEAVSVFGARALHWAAWMGAASTVDLLIARGARIEARCSQFGATPLFWSVHGFGPDGPTPKKDQVGAARSLIRAGADIRTTNHHGQSALDLAALCNGDAMRTLLEQPE